MNIEIKLFWLHIISNLKGQVPIQYILFMLLSSKLSFGELNCRSYHRSYRSTLQIVSSHPHYIFGCQYHCEISGDSMCSIRRPIICHLACGQKVKNIPALIYAKNCGLQKVFQETVTQDVIILKKKHYKKQITITGVVCLRKHQSTPCTNFKSAPPYRQHVKVSLLLHILDCQGNVAKPKTRSQVR